MKIINSIKNYRYYFEDRVEGDAVCGCIVETKPLTEWRQLIDCQTKNGEIVVFDLFGQTEDTKVLSLDWEYFTNDDIITFCDMLDLKLNESSVRKVEGKANYYRAEAVINETTSMFVSLAVKNYSDKNFHIVVFNFDDGDSRRIPKMYIHGIWDIMVSESIYEKFLKK